MSLYYLGVENPSQSHFSLQFGLVRLYEMDVGILGGGGKKNCQPSKITIIKK